MSRFMLIILATAQIGCSGFRKRFAESPGTIWNPGQNKHAFYSPDAKKYESERYENIINTYNQNEQRAKENGWDNRQEDPSDYWYYLNLHQ